MEGSMVITTANDTSNARFARSSGVASLRAFEAQILTAAKRRPLARRKRRKIWTIG